eukprot:gene4020-10843_t
MPEDQAMTAVDAAGPAEASSPEEATAEEMAIAALESASTSLTESCRTKVAAFEAAEAGLIEHVSVYIRTDLEKLRFGGQKDGSSSCTTLTKCDDYVVVVRLTKQAHRESETTQPKPPTQPAKPQICERAPKSKACFRLRSWQTLRTSATPGHELADPAY